MGVLSRTIQGTIFPLTPALVAPGTTYNPNFANPADPTGAGIPVSEGFLIGYQVTLTAGVIGTITVTAFDGVIPLMQTQFVFAAVGEVASDCLDCPMPFYGRTATRLNFNVTASIGGMSVEVIGIMAAGDLTPYLGP